MLHFWIKCTTMNNFNWTYSWYWSWLMFWTENVYVSQWNLEIPKKQRTKKQENKFRNFFDKILLCARPLTMWCTFGTFHSKLYQIFHAIFLKETPLKPLYYWFLAFKMFNSSILVPILWKLIFFNFIEQYFVILILFIFTLHTQFTHIVISNVKNKL